MPASNKAGILRRIPDKTKKRVRTGAAKLLICLNSLLLSLILTYVVPMAMQDNRGEISKAEQRPVILKIMASPTMSLLSFEPLVFRKSIILFKRKPARIPNPTAAIFRNIGNKSTNMPTYSPELESNS